MLFKFLSTLSLRRATKAIIECNGGDPISIHALLAESDLPGQVCLLVVIPFLSTLSLRRATCPKASAAPPLMQFLSTLSLRRATTRPCMRRTVEPDFYPRSPCGERHYFCKDHYAAVSISIHALLAESDWTRRRRSTPRKTFLSTLSLRRATPALAVQPKPPPSFLSTLSLRRATFWCQLMVRSFIISIHALLAESDARQCYTDTTSVGFLSTLSLRRATAIGRWGTAWRDISIHALLAESDQNLSNRLQSIGYFYPRSPCGERLKQGLTEILLPIFLSTLSLRRATRPSPPYRSRRRGISIHALLAESDSKSAQNSGAL